MSTGRPPIVRSSGCGTAKVKVAEPGGSLTTVTDRFAPAVAALIKPLILT